MQIGLKISPATFPHAVDIILLKYKWQTCLVYLDDIINFSSSMGEHTKQVDSILDALRKSGLSFNLRKCLFFTKEIPYLGHIIRPGSLDIAEASIATLKGLRHSRTASVLRSFLGLCNAYRRFIAGCTDTAAPLYCL